MAGIFLVASASATDLNETIISEIDSNVDNGQISVETIEDNQNDLTINESMESEVKSVDDSQMLTANYTPKDSNEIQSYIDSASDGDTIVLDGNYLFTSTVNVAKQLNFVGINDATVDGNNSVSLFTVSNGGVTFKDITFKNGRTDDYYSGGAITGTFTVVNCSFINNYAKEYGGAIYGEYCTIVNSSFIGNSAHYYSGGAVYNKYGGSCVNCSFINNYAGSDGGAVYGGSCVNCSFTGNSAGSEGGALHSKDGSCVNCSFINNHAVLYGGAIYVLYGGPVINCSFIDNSADYYGGAIYLGVFNREADSAIVSNCYFKNNFASYYNGGAIHFEKIKNVQVVGSEFIDCYSKSQGGAFYLNSASNLKITKCIFKDCISGEGTSYIGFNEIPNYDISDCIFDKYPADFENYYENLLIEAEDLAIILGHDDLLRIRLSDFTGYLANKRMVVSFNNYTFYNTTDLDGVTTFNFSSVAELGKFNLNISLVEKKNYTNYFKVIGLTVSHHIINPESDLQSVINNAKTGDTISINGTYSLTSTININKQLNFVGANDATVDGNNSVGLFSVSNGGVTFKDITFKNGKATRGGAINGACTVLNCTFESNFASEDGGALYGGIARNCTFLRNSANGYGGAVVNVNAIDCTFIGNTAEYGGAIANCVADMGSAWDDYEYYLIDKCIFENNVAKTSSGAIFIYSTRKMVCNITNSYFEKNSAEICGAIGLANARNFVVNCTFKENKVSDSSTTNGGAIFANGAKIINCIFVGNSNRYGDGGALYRGYAINCSFYNNYADEGAAIYGGTAVNCLFKDNSARSDGGALYSTSAINCSFEGNSAKWDGGAIYKGSAINCSFVANTAKHVGYAIYDVDAVDCSFENYVEGDINGGTVTNCNFITNSFPKNFDEIYTYIANANPGDVIVLSGSYLWIESDDYIQGVRFSYGFSIRKSLTFVGINNATIEGYTNARLFRIFSEDVTFKDITFMNANSNKGDGKGGAIYAEANFTLENCRFINNTAKNGGAIYVCENAECNMTNCYFENNVGRAIFVEGNANLVNCVFKENTEGATNGGTAINCSFITNSLYRGNGGAMCGGIAINCSFMDNSVDLGDGAALYGTTAIGCSFVSNHAGNHAIFCNGNIINCTFENNSGDSVVCNSKVIDGTFKNNHGDKSGAINGGTAINCTFISNSASSSFSSGAIYRGNAINCTFIGNSVEYGYSGAMYGGSAVNCSFINNIGYLYGGAANGVSAVNCSFINNLADMGGAMYGGSAVDCSFINNTGGAGGALQGSTAINCSFINNYAESGGGAIFDCHVTNCTFIENSAYRDGGAMQNGIAIDCIFMNNVAGICTTSSCSGGAIHEGTAINCVFIENAAEYGGAISIENPGYVIDNCSFINNSAKYGGAIAKLFTKKNCSLQIYNSIFTNNIAIIENGDLWKENKYEYEEIGGGAIFLDNCNPTISNCYFEKNNVDGFGGAINLKQSSDADINNCQFKDCYSTNDGSAIYWESGDNLSITYCTFDNCTNPNGSYLSFNENVGDYIVSDCLFDEPPVGINYSDTYNPIINVNDLSIYIGEDGILNVHLFDINGPLSSKTITFTVNNNDYINITDTEGFTTFNIKNYLTEVGNHTVGISFAGEGLDNPASKNVTVSINRYDSLLTVNNLSVHVNENGYLIANLSNARGPLSDKTVTLNVNGKSYGKTTSSDGQAQFNIKDYLSSGGQYNVTVSFAGDEYNNPVSANASVYLSKYNPILTVNNLSIFVDEDGILKGKLYNNAGPLVSKLVTFYFTNRITKTTSYNGEFSLDIKKDAKLTSAGQYNITVAFAGDNQNNPVSIIVSILINKYDTNLNVDNLSIFKDEGGFLCVNLSDSRSALSDKTIVLTIGDDSYMNVTDSNGFATFNIKEYLSQEGNYSVEVSFWGDDFNNPVSASASVNILKHQSSLSANDLTVNVGEDGNLVAYLSDDRGALANKTLIFSINGTNHTFMADDGSVAINIKDYLFSAGDYVIGITFEGDEYEIGCYCQSNVRINNYEGTLSVVQIGSYYNDTYLTIKLINSKTGLNIPDANVELVFSNYEVGYIVTDENGEATYKVGFAPGSYGVSANVVDDFVDVDEARLNVAVQLIAGQIAVTQLNNTALAVRLYNPVDSHVYRNVNVILRFNNEPLVELTTNDNGVAIYTMSVAFGSYPIFVSVTSDYTSFDPIDTKIDITNITGGGGSGDTKKDSFIGFDPIVFYYGGVGMTTVHRDGCTISRETISVEGHDDAFIDLVGDDIYISGLDVGSYTLRVTTIPDENYYAVNQTSSITVSNIPVTILASSSSIYYNSGNVWSVKLYNTKTKAVLSGMKVSIKVYSGSKIYKSFNLNTDSKGMVTLKVSTWAVGAYKVVVSFSKHGYAASPVNRVLTIKKTPVVITAPKLSVYLKTAKKWSIKVVDSKTKKAIASTKLTLKVYTGKKFKNYAVKTNSKGVATFATSGLAVGTHKVVVSFSKTGYVSKSVSSSIVVKPIPLTIKGDFSYGSGGSTVRVTVTNKLTGKPANGISVKLIVYTGSKVTKSYTLVTGNYKTYKGFVGFGTNAFSVGTHKVVIKPVSNMYSGQGTTSLVIKSGAANGGTYYSFVSRGKLTLS